MAISINQLRSQRLGVVRGLLGVTKPIEQALNSLQRVSRQVLARRNKLPEPADLAKIIEQYNKIVSASRTFEQAVATAKNAFIA